MRIYGAAQVVAVRVLPAALRAAVPVCCRAVPTVTVAAVPVGSLAAVPVLASVPLLAFVPVLRSGPPTRRRWRRRVRRGVRIAHETPCGRGLDPFSQMARAALRSLAVKPKRIVVLISGGGSNLAALLRAAAEADYGAQIVAVGADRPSAAGLQLAADAGVPTFVCRLKDYPERSDWDAALTAEVVAHEPDLVISAGFLKLVGPQFLAAFGGRYLNTHNSLLPAFPGIHGPRDALEYGVKVAGATLFVVDDGVDTGAIIAQTAVPVLDEDTEETLTERIKVAERAQLVEQVGRLAREGWRVQGRRVHIG